MSASKSISVVPPQLPELQHAVVNDHVAAVIFGVHSQCLIVWVLQVVGYHPIVHERNNSGIFQQVRCFLIFAEVMIDSVCIETLGTTETLSAGAVG
jgi:hypothetical protein